MTHPFTPPPDEPLSLPILKVAVPVPLGRGEAVIYDYLPLSTQNLDYTHSSDPLAPYVKGQIVLVPVGRQHLWGIVTDLTFRTDIALARLKTVIRIADSPPLTDLHLKFLKQVSLITLAPFGSVMKLMLNCPAALEPPAMVTLYHLIPNHNKHVADMGLKMTPQRQRLIASAVSLPPLPLSDLAREAGVSPAVIQTLVRSGLFIQSVQPRTEPRMAMTPAEHPQIMLNDTQKQISKHLHDSIKAGYSAHLLDGVPGSGKTELYFSVVATALKAKRQVLILLPEIVLTTAWQQRFETWFGYRPDIWHSGLAAARRRQLWRRVIRGEPIVVAGARSALFLPFTKLGLIVVDEEHDASFKQEDYVNYQGRDMAHLRARIHDVPLVLASATPSLESWVSATEGAEKWHYHSLTERFGTARLPQVRAIDLRQHRPGAGKWISPPLAEALANRLKHKQQSLLFVNRRGYAPMTICDSCGFRLCCHQCDSLLVTHRLAAKMQCHICGHSEPLHTSCPNCERKGSLRAVGPGVERLSDEVASLFPDARILLFSSDSMARPAEAEAHLKSIIEGDVDIIIGTQMAAKGHHFPYLTLVGVIDADLGLGGGDLRASERTYQLLWQVAGRAGREGYEGEVLIQTYQSSHPVMQALCSVPEETEEAALTRRHHFMLTEKDARAQAGMPPFGRLAAVILTSADFPKLEQATARLEESRPDFAQTQIFGPAPAVLSRARGQFRMRYLIRVDTGVSVQRIIKQWIEGISLPSGVRLSCDIDPYSFM